LCKLNSDIRSALKLSKMSLAASGGGGDISINVIDCRFKLKTWCVCDY
jgi:hypothetical protein